MTKRLEGKAGCVRRMVVGEDEKGVEIEVEGGKSAIGGVKGAGENEFKVSKEGVKVGDGHKDSLVEGKATTGDGGVGIGGTKVILVVTAGK